MKNWKKQLSPLLSVVMLFSTFSQTAVPIIAYAETATDDPAEETVDVAAADETLPTLVTTAEELIEFIQEFVVIENVEIVDAQTEEKATIYTAVTEDDIEFLIRDEAGTLELEVGLLYSAISGMAVETEDGEFHIAPESAEDIELAAEQAEVPVLEEENETEEDVEETVEAEAASEEEDLDAEAENTDEDSIDEEPVDEELAADAEDADAEEEETEGDNALAVAADAPATIEPAQAEETFDLSLMHMNDTHARVEKYPSMVSAVESFRAENPEALLIHAGDVFSGTLYFNEFEGQADLALLNLMGIDAFTFGNHEFDLGSPHQALANFVSGANFPFLGTNIDFSSDPIMAPLETNATLVSNPADGQIYNSIILEANGEQIGVFGLTTEDTANIASPGSVAFSNYISAAEEAVAQFEAAGINKIIAVTHLGYASSPTYGNDIVLANQVEGIDIIVGGHSHTALAAPDVIDAGAAPTVIVQAGANADNLGTLNVTFNEAGEIIDQNGALRPVGNYEPNPAALDVLAEYQEVVEGINNEVTGAVAVRDLENPRHNVDADTNSVRANETPLGNLVTDAMLAKTKELYPEAVIAVQNGGGIRAPIAAGEITTGEVIEVLPFGNNPVIVELTGQELKDLFEISYGANQRPAGGLEENGGFLHIAGAKIYFDSTRPAGDRVVAMYVERGDELVEIQLDEGYLVTTNAFTGAGGDGLTPFAEAYAEGRVQDTGAIDWEQLRDYMVEEQYLNGTVDPVIEGRIVDLMGEELPTDPEEPTDSAEQIAELEGRIEALEKAINELESDNEALQAELDALRELLASLQADLEAGETALEELERRITELEARLAALEEKVEAEPTTPTDPDPKPAEPRPTVPTEPGDSDDDGDTGAPGAPATPGEQPAEADADGKPLPKTGTNMESTIYIGVVVLLSGGLLFVISKKKRA